MTNRNSPTRKSHADREKTPSSDRRQDARVPTTLKVLVKSAIEDEFMELRTSDISVTGAFITSPTPLRVGTLVKISAKDAGGIEGVGRVVWLRDPEQSSTDKPAGMGIKFVRLSEQTTQQLAQITATLAAHPENPELFFVGDDQEDDQSDAYPGHDSGVRAVPPQPRSDAKAVVPGPTRKAPASPEHALEATSSSAVVESVQTQAAAPMSAESPQVSKGSAVEPNPAASQPHAQTIDARPVRKTAAKAKPQRTGSLVLKGAVAAATLCALGALWVTLDEPDTRSAEQRNAAPVPALPAAPSGITSSQQNVAQVPAVPTPSTAPAQLVSVAVTTKPEGAEVFIGDSSRGTAPLNLQLQAGTPVTVRARARHYAEASVELTPAPSQAPLRIELKELPYVLHVESDPPGAWLFVAGQKARAPVDITLPNYDGKRVGMRAGLFGYEDQTLYVLPEEFVEGKDARRAVVKLDLGHRVQKSLDEVAKPHVDEAPSDQAPDGTPPQASDRGPSLEPGDELAPSEH